MQRVRIPLFSLVFLLLTFSAGQTHGEPPEGPLAVLALVHDGEEEALARLAAAVQKELIAAGQIEVLSTEEIVQLLSGGGRRTSSDQDLDQLEGLFQQGYLQSYSFRYEKALTTLHRVIVGLDRLPPSEPGWQLWIKAKIFQGISLAGLKNERAALRSFAEILRTRPDMELSSKDYSPRIIGLWNKAGQRLGSLPKGQLIVESDPSGGKVLLDGQLVGTTPYIGRFPYGHYHLWVVHPQTGGAVRQIEISENPSRSRLQLSFEGSLVLDGMHPCVRLPAGEERLPEHWWPWLGDRLGLRHLIVVRRHVEDDRNYLAASLVNLESGRKLREGWLESTGDEPEELEQHAMDLADFLATGKAVSRMKVRAAPPVTIAPPPPSRVPDLPIHYAPRPWYWKWWPYAVAGGVILGIGVGSHLTSDYYSRKAADLIVVADQDRANRYADAWWKVAITGYALGAGTALAGLILYLVYEPVEVLPDSALVPAVGPESAGVVWVVRF